MIRTTSVSGMRGWYRSRPWPKGDGDHEPLRGPRGRERDDLVVDEAVLPGRRDHLHVAERRRLALARDDPDGAGRPDPLAEIREHEQLSGGVGREHDDVGL